MKALLVDDDLTILHLLQSVLVRRGYEVDAYADPIDCPLYQAPSCTSCAPSAEKCPDLILTDIVMPHANGFEFLEKVKSNGCKCRHIAVMSGDWQDRYVLNASQMGVRVFEKPFSIREFVGWLGTVENEDAAASVPAGG
jgi:DNA-binding response OmpR family regulator